MKPTSVFLLLGLLVLSLASHAAAEARLHGKVSSHGIALPDVRIELRANGSGRIAWSGSDGAWEIGGLPDGERASIRAEHHGFVTQQKELSLGADSTLDFDLQLEDVRETVVVTDGLLSVRSDAPEKSQTLTSQQIQELPSNGRRVMRFALLSPHVRQAIGLGADSADSNRLSINASSYRHTSYVLDGTANYDWIYANGPQQTVSAGAVEQFKILSGQYAAEFGTSTAGVLVVATKSGSNDIHGEAFAFVRPSGIQAQAPLATAGFPRIPNEREQWGASIGGPLARDRTFVFLNYEGAHQKRGAYIQLPTPSFFPGTQNEQYALAKLDHRFNDHHWLSWRSNGYLFNGNNVNDRISGFNQPSYGRETRSQSWGSQLNLYSLKGSLLNELRLSFVSYFPDSAFPLESSVQISRPSYSVEGYSTNNWVHAKTYNIGNVVAVRKGSHELKFGLDYIRQFVKDYSYTPFGTYTFASGAPVEGQQPLRYAQTFGASDFRYGQSVTSGFAQDDVHLAPRLTLNVGLRYEYQSITDDKNNFAPRVGLAWDATGDGRTTVRAGAGMFYDQYYLYIYRRFYSLNPFAPTASYTIPYGDPEFPQFPNPLTQAPSTGGSAGRRDLYIPADEMRNPYSLQYSLAVERQLGKGFVLTVDGIHSHVLRQMRVNDINHPEPFVRTSAGQVRSAAAADTTRAYAEWQGVPVRLLAVIENSASSIYDAFSIGLTHRLDSRFLIDFHYTASSSATYSMFYADANSGIPNEWDNWGSAERAPSDFYQQHRFAGNGLVRLPLNFQLAATAIVGSGLPVNPLTGKDNNGDTYSVDRPVGFGRNSFRTPMQTQFDASLSRRFRLTEQFTLEARAEAYNVINRNNYIEVNKVYGDGNAPVSTFLQPIAGVTRTDPSRQFQFGLKLHF